MLDKNRAKRLKRFFVDVDTSILNSPHPNISLSENYIIYNQKFGKLLFLHIILTLISILLAYCLNSLFYLGLFFIPIGFILNKLFPNQERIYFDKEGIITTGFFHIKKKYLYNDILDIYLEDSPTRCNVYGLLENDKFLVGLSLNNENAEQLMNVVKAVITLEGNIEQQQEKTS